MFSSKSNEWTTPQDLFDRLNAIYNFNLDPASTDDNAKCEKHFTEADDGLQQNWGGTVCFVTRLMEKRFQNGLRRLMRNPENQEQRLLC